jgi:hypothetical protein
LYTAAKVLFQLQDTHAAVSAFINQSNESAPLRFLYHHLWHNGDAVTRSNHGQNGCELAAFENHVQLKVALAANGKGILPEAVALFEQQERIISHLRT